jgi:hypothetical protein
MFARTRGQRVQWPLINLSPELQRLPQNLSNRWQFSLQFKNILYLHFFSNSGLEIHDSIQGICRGAPTPAISIAFLGALPVPCAPRQISLQYFQLKMCKNCCTPLLTLKLEPANSYSKFVDRNSQSPTVQNVSYPQIWLWLHDLHINIKPVHMQDYISAVLSRSLKFLKFHSVRSLKFIHCTVHVQLYIDWLH